MQVLLASKALTAKIFAFSYAPLFLRFLPASYSLFIVMIFSLAYHVTLLGKSFSFFTPGLATAL